MMAMSRVLTTTVLAGALAGCAHSRGADEIDPDLQPLQPMAQEQAPTFEPDEEIGTPDAPGVELIGEKAPDPKGPTQHVVMEGEDASSPVITSQPKRPKRGSFMSGIKMAPTGD
jgi:hypothetical protein